MKNLLIILFAFLSVPAFAQQPARQMIYGKNHIFAVETPENWMNDRGLAAQFKLASFFYAKSDSSKSRPSYMYAMGYDKTDPEETLKGFISGNLQSLRRTYPNFTYKKSQVGATGQILNAEMLAYDNLGDRFKEEVIYLETEHAFIVFSFAAFSEEDYWKYQSVFDQFVSSFRYLGNEPQAYLQKAQ